MCSLMFYLFAIPGVLLCLFVISHAIYLLWFHPYAKYPGPLLARLTPFHALWHAYVGDLHLDALRCHELYGDIVRYGPNRLLINRPEAVRAIYGQGKNFKKSNAYAPHPFFPTVFNTHNCIDASQHGRKRRVVAQAFSEGGLAAYEPRIIEQVDVLCYALASDIGLDGWSQPKDMAEWTNYFTLDVISALTFGRCFEMLRSTRFHWLVQAIVEGNRHIYLRFACPALFNLNPAAWYAPARWLFPGLSTQRHGFVDVANDLTSKRPASDCRDRKGQRDIMGELEAARDPKTGDCLSAEEIASEAHLMIAAGGDTTSTALSAALFYLSRSPRAYKSLANEIRTTFSSVGQIHRGPVLSSCRYLRACIDEALRLAPAAPGALWRQAGWNGAFVEEAFIPAGLEVGTCTYALSHDARYFDQPFTFRPERWFNSPSEGLEVIHAEKSRYETSSIRANCYTDAAFFYSAEKPALKEIIQDPIPVDNLSASVPFGIGPRSCLAKPLAYLELSLALARMIYLLDFEAVDKTGCGGPGLGQGRERVEEFQIVDMFSSNKQGPILRFRKTGADLSQADSAVGTIAGK